MKLLKTKDSCQICSTKEKKIISEIGRDLKKLVTVICTGCGLIHSYPIPKKKRIKRIL